MADYLRVPPGSHSKQISVLTLSLIDNTKSTG